MTDRELLQAAAKAAKIKIGEWNPGLESYSSDEGFILPDNSTWNPLNWTSDAMELAMLLEIYICSVRDRHGVVASICIAPGMIGGTHDLAYGISAMRCAVVHVAAELGRNLE